MSQQLRHKETKAQTLPDMGRTSSTIPFPLHQATPAHLQEPPQLLRPHQGLPRAQRPWCLCSLASCLRPTKALLTDGCPTPAPGFTGEFAFQTLRTTSTTFSKVNLPGQGFLPIPLDWTINSLRAGNWLYVSVTSRRLGQQSPKPYLTTGTGGSSWASMSYNSQCSKYVHPFALSFSHLHGNLIKRLRLPFLYGL